MVSVAACSLYEATLVFFTTTLIQGASWREEKGQVDREWQAFPLDVCLHGVVQLLCTYFTAARAAFPRVLNVSGHALASKVKINPELVNFRRTGQLGTLDTG